MVNCSSPIVSIVGAAGLSRVGEIVIIEPLLALPCVSIATTFTVYVEKFANP